ncbi:MAG: hypothetical protein E4G98_05980 [Promethearchaeota archaeon]|nr:MAG: hypothetical protein E4G98_05980 [Candidatus Lokiarchaeota archaeon]
MAESDISSGSKYDIVSEKEKPEKLERNVPSKREKSDIVKKSKTNFTLLTFLWFGYHIASKIIPASLLWAYMDLIVFPLFKIPIFTALSQKPNIFIFISIPAALLGIYLIDLFMSALVGKIIYAIMNRVHPRKELLKALPEGDTADDVDIYHYRNFVLRLVKWKFTKGAFPYLTTWIFNFIGASKIGKNCVIEECIFPMEYLEMGDNSYIGTGTISSSHLVEGKYASLTIKAIKLGQNAVCGAHSILAPGFEMGKGSQLLPQSGVPKFTKIKSGVNYWGIPAGRLSRKRYYDFIKVPKDLQS